MRSHRKLRQELYDYATGGLAPNSRAQVESHLAACAACRESLENVRASVALLDRPEPLPSEQRTAEFWSEFPRDIEERIARENPPNPGIADIVVEFGSAVWSSGRRIATAAAAVAALTAFFLIHRTGPEAHVVPLDAQILTPAKTDSTGVRMSRYLRKSKILLVGLSNMKVTQGRPLDLSDEQSLSRQLIHEGRYLRQQPLTTRSVKLIDDLDRVFVELSNAGSRPPVPQFDVIRGGIRRENLLFKVRMAEGSFEDDGK